MSWSNPFRHLHELNKDTNRYLKNQVNYIKAHTRYLFVFVDLSQPIRLINLEQLPNFLDYTLLSTPEMFWQNEYHDLNDVSDAYLLDPCVLRIMREANDFVVVTLSEQTLGDLVVHSRGLEKPASIVFYTKGDDTVGFYWSETNLSSDSIDQLWVSARQAINS